MSDNPFEVINQRLDLIEASLQHIDSKVSVIPARPVEDELLGVHEAAKFLKLSVSTIYHKISKRQLPFIKTDRKCYFSKNELIAYLNTGRRKSLSELTEAADQRQNK